MKSRRNAKTRSNDPTGVAASSPGKRRQLTIRKKQKREQLIKRVMETQETVKAEKLYGKGLASMHDIHAAVDDIQKSFEAKALRVRFSALSKNLGKSTLSLSGIAEEEAEGIKVLFDRWTGSLTLSFDEICDQARRKLELDAEDRKIKLENYNEIKSSSVISGKN